MVISRIHLSKMHGVHLRKMHGVTCTTIFTTTICIDWMWKWKSILALGHHLPPDKMVKLGVRGVVIVAFFFRKNTPPTQDNITKIIATSLYTLSWNSHHSYPSLDFIDSGPHFIRFCFILSPSMEFSFFIFSHKICTLHSELGTVIQ